MDGSELTQADLGQRRPSAKALLIPPGAARVVVRPANHGTVERVFEIQAGPTRVPSGQDRRHIEA
jgi:hypothetical protein